MELWAVLGLCCIDHEFRKAIYDDPVHAVEHYRFRLSRFEIGELERMRKKPHVRKSQEQIQAGLWDDICPIGLVHNDRYVHPEPEVFEKLIKDREQKPPKP